MPADQALPIHGGQRFRVLEVDHDLIAQPMGEQPGEAEFGRHGEGFAAAQRHEVARVGPPTKVVSRVAVSPPRGVIAASTAWGVVSLLDCADPAIREEGQGNHGSPLSKTELNQGAPRKKKKKPYCLRASRRSWPSSRMAGSPRSTKRRPPRPCWRRSPRVGETATLETTFVGADTGHLMPLGGGEALSMPPELGFTRLLAHGLGDQVVIHLQDSEALSPVNWEGLVGGRGAFIGDSLRWAYLLTCPNSIVISVEDGKVVDAVLNRP